MKRTVVLAALLAPIAAGPARLLGGTPPPPREGPTAELARLIDRADRLVVRQGPGPGAKVLFESADRGDLDALKAALKVERPAEPVHCMCDGSPAIDLYAGKTPVGRISNHHAKLVRWSTSETDAPLAAPEAWLAWFDARGIKGPREEFDASRRNLARFEEAQRKWVAGMPPALRPIWDRWMKGGPDPRDDFRTTLERTIPDRGRRIRALFAWFGSGMGPWSGFPSYESAAEEMLLDYPTDELLAAVEGQALSEAEAEGVARLFGGWQFSQVRPKDRALIPADLKRRLLEHSLKSDNADKRGRAERAFGGGRSTP